VWNLDAGDGAMVLEDQGLADHSGGLASVCEWVFPLARGYGTSGAEPLRRVDAPRLDSVAGKAALNRVI
jgi:hypothetical protein